MQASEPLIRSRAVLASQVLAIDVKAARRTTGAVTPESLASQREKMSQTREHGAQRAARLNILRGLTDKDNKQLALPSQQLPPTP